VEGSKERRNGARAIGGRGEMGRSRVGGKGGRMICDYCVFEFESFSIPMNR